MKNKINLFILFLFIIKYIMKTIKKENYQNEGIFINLDKDFKPYNNLL
ncbi:MAG: hypothetical protein GX265_05540, partial [Mollicutes bacterium]|nr:hypothetical protein [Mollicutes bacterium]